MLQRTSRLGGFRKSVLATTALVAVHAAPVRAQEAASNQTQFEAAVTNVNADPSRRVVITGNFNVSSPAVQAQTEIDIALNNVGQGYRLGISGLNGTNGRLNVTGIGADSVLTLTGTNGFNGLTGTTSVIAFDGDAALGIGPVALNSQTFRALNDVSVSKAISLGALGATIDTGGHVMAVSGVISGGSPLFAFGTGTLVLSGANTYSAATNLLDGVTLRAGATNVVSSASAVILNNNATMDLAGFDQSIGSLQSASASSRVLVGNATLATGSDGSSTSFQGVISGAGSLAKVGSGRLTLTGANTYTGTTTISGGFLRVGGGNLGTVASRDLRLTGGVLELLSSGAVPTGASLTQTGGLLQVGQSLQLAALAGSGGSGVQLLGGAVLTVGGSNGNDVYGGSIGIPGATAGALTKVGAGTYTLNGASGYTGNTTIASGTLQLGNGGTTGSIATSAAVVAGGTLAFNRSDANSFDRAVSGSGIVLNRGLGAVTLAGVLTNGGIQSEVGSGGVVVTGRLTTAGTGLTGSNPAALVDRGGTQIVVDGGIVSATSAAGMEDGVQLNGGTLQVRSGSITAKTSGVYVRTGGTVANGGAISGGDSAIYFAGVGAQSVSVTGNGTYSGATYMGIYAHAATGDVTLGSTSSALGSVSGGLSGIDAGSQGGGVTINAVGAISGANGAGIAATSALGTTVVAAGDVTGTTSGIVARANAGSVTVRVGSVVGGIAVTASNAALVRSSGAISSTGRAAIDVVAGSGPIEVEALGNVTAASGAGAAIVLNGSGSNRITIGAAGGSTAPLVRGDVGIRVAGPGVTTLANYGTITSGGNAIQIDTGTLAIEQVGTLTGNIAVAAPQSSLNFAVAGPATVSNVITGNGSLVQAGAGTLELTGANGAAAGQFTGAATVLAGTLAVNGVFGDTVGNAAFVTVASGGTLHGSGVIAGSVNVASGGIVSAGNSPGTLTVAGNYTLLSGATSLFELGTPGTVGGATNDHVIVGEDLTLGGTLRLVDATTSLRAPVAGSYRLYDYAGALSGAFETITLPTAASATVYTSVPGQVNVLIANAGQTVQYWDGGDATGAGTGGQGGDGDWNAIGTNWTGAPDSSVNAGWGGGVGIFAGAPGAVTLTGSQDVQGLQFTVDGYHVAGPGTLNLVGDPFTTPKQSFVTVDRGVVATIDTSLSGGVGVGLEKLGTGVLVLGGANTFSGATSVSDGTLILKQGAGVAGDVTVASGATFTNLGDVAGGLNSLGSASNAGVIVGTVSNSGAFVNTGSVLGAFVNTAGTGVNSGTLGAGVTVSGGSLDLAAGSAVTGAVSNSGVVTAQGRIDGAVTNTGVGSFTVSGTLAGISAFANEGTLSLASNDLTVGALLGDVGSAVVQNGGMVDATLTLGEGDRDGSYAGSLRDGSGGGRLLLAKRGAGVMTLSGTNLYTGGTAVSEGVLRAGATGALSSRSAVSVGDGATLDLAGYDQAIGSLAGRGSVTLGQATLTTGADGSSTLFSGSIAGTGGLDKVGEGTLTLAGDNGYTGATNVTAGRLVIAGRLSSAVANRAALDNTGVIDGGLDNQGSAENDGTIAGLVTNRGTLVTTGRLGQGLTNSGSVLAQGRVEGVIVNSGTLRLTGVVEGTEGLTNEGIIDLGGTAFGVASLSGSDAGAVVRNGRLTAGSGGSDTVYAGRIEDGAAAATLTKVGTGTLTLTGANTYTGATTVAAGTLNVAGSLASVVTVSKGAELAGAGSVAGMVVADGAIVAPGGSGAIGTLAVNGGVNFAAGSRYQVNATSAGMADRIVATGAATLGGGTVQVVAGTGEYATRTRYTILSAAGGVSGQFADVSSNLAFLTPLLSYDANDVYLTLARNDIRFSSVATTRNQAGVALAVELGGVGNGLYDGVSLLSAAQARDAFDGLSGEIHSSAISAQVSTAYLVREALLDRLRAQHVGAQADVTPLRSLWGQTFGTSGSVGATAETAALRQHVWGIAVGADTTVADGWRAGVSGGYTKTTLNVAKRLSSGSIESGFGALYGGTAYGPVRFDFGASLAWSSFDTRREVVFPGTAQMLRAQYNGTQGQFFGEVGYRFGDAADVLEPFLSGAVMHVSRDGFSERGGEASLAAARQDYDVATSTIGLRGSGSIEKLVGLGTPLLVRGLAGYRHAYGDVVPRTSLSLGSADASFETVGAPVARDALVLQAGVEWRLAPGAAFSAAYTGQLGSNQTRDHGLKGSFTFNW